MTDMTTTIKSNDDFINFNLYQYCAILIDGMFGKLITIYNTTTQDVYFLASELSEKLDYFDTRKLTRILDIDEFGCPSQGLLNKIKDLQTLFGEINPRGMTLVNLSGAFHAAFKSTKSEAREFRKFVTSVILPQIYKTGSYSTTDNSNNQLSISQILLEMKSDMNLQLLNTQQLLATQSSQYQLQLVDLEDRLTKKLKVQIEFKRHGVKSPRSCTDIDGFVIYINTNNNIHTTKHEIHKFLRTFGFMDQFSTMPTELGLKSNAIGLESVPIIYQDGSVGKSVKTVIYTDMFEHAENAFLNFTKLNNSPTPTSISQIN